jgi:hypothetical protein
VRASHSPDAEDLSDPPGSGSPQQRGRHQRRLDENGLAGHFCGRGQPQPQHLHAAQGAGRASARPPLRRYGARPGYRLAENVQLVPDEELSIVAASHSTVQVQVEETKPWAWISVAVILLLAVAAGTYRFFSHRATVLSEKDTVVLADFANSTGDSVFDGTLRQGMAVQLEQSPFLSLISEARIQHTLRLMGRSADAPLTPELAREICERHRKRCRPGRFDCKPGKPVRIGVTGKELPHRRHPR